MSFTFIDAGSPNNEIRTNVWNWKPTLEIIRELDVIGEMAVRQMQYNATGFQVGADEAGMIANGIRSKYLSRMKPQDRVRMDLSITNEPDDGTLYRGDDSQAWKNYGATYDWLEEFSNFCLKSQGFQIF